MAIELDATKHADAGEMGWNGYTNEQLHAAFKLVKDVTNWKLPINRILDEPTPEQVSLITTAIVFFTGGRPSFKSLPSGNLRVTAPGYYASVGA